MSWLAAARKRVLERLASSATVLARASSPLRRSQLGGALVDAHFQELVGGLERLLGLNRLRHVGVGGDDAAVRQPRRAHFDHAMGREESEAARLVVVEEGRDALGDEILRIARPIGAARSVEAHDLVEADAMAQHRGRQVEEVGEFPVPGGQREVRIENRDALARMVERVLQLVAARLDRRRGFVDQFQRRFARDGARPQAAATAPGARSRRRWRATAGIPRGGSDGRPPPATDRSRGRVPRMKAEKARRARPAPR